MDSLNPWGIHDDPGSALDFAQQRQLVDARGRTDLWDFEIGKSKGNYRELVEKSEGNQREIIGNLWRNQKEIKGKS